MCVLPALLYLFYGVLKKTKLPKVEMRSIQDMFKEMVNNEKKNND